MMVRLRPDIIHTHHDSLIRLLPFVDAPKVLTVHATGIELTGHLAKYDQVFCISEAVRDDVFERYPGCVPVVVCNGVCASRFMQKNGQGSGDFRIVQISRLDHEIKGQDILIRAVSELGKMDGISGITLDFIGEGRSRGYLEKLADDCGISDKCRFLGEQTRDYIYSNLHTYDLLVQPSRSEGFGLTIAEGMAARVPVLVSRVAGPMEIIGQGDFGHSFESGNVQDCARRISSICHELRTGGLSTQIDKAHQHVVSRFDIGMTASAYRTEYLRIIGRHRRN